MSHWHRAFNTSVNSGSVWNTRFATPSRAIGHRYSAGGSSGVQLGWRCNATLGYLFSVTSGSTLSQPPCR